MRRHGGRVNWGSGLRRSATHSVACAFIGKGANKIWRWHNVSVWLLHLETELFTGASVPKIASFQT